MGTANNSNSFDFHHSNQYQAQHPLTDMSGNYSNIVITSSPLKNSNFYFNDDADTMSAQNENININLTPSKTILQDPALQFLYQGVPQQQQQMRQTQSAYTNQNQAPQDSNETDDEKTDDESGNGQTEETQPQHSYQSYPQHQPQMLQFPPTIQNSAQLQQQQHPIYYMPQGQALPVPQFVHPQNVNMAMNMNMGVGVPMNMGMGMNMGLNGMLNMNMANAYAQQQQQQQFVPSTQQQTNLYPPVEHLPASASNTARSSSSTSSSAGRLPESNSNNTISSFDSIPAFMVSSSISDPSIASPSSSFNNTTLMTPQRQPMHTHTNTNTSTNGGGSATGRRTSVTMTPTSFKTPSRSQSFVVPVLAQGSQVSPKLVRTAPNRRNTTSSVTTTAAATSGTGPAIKAHRRSRSRLSADPSGAASIVTSLSEHRLPTFLQRSPTAAAASASGTNPFYPHSNLISPHHPGSRLTTSQSLNNLHSPVSTPLATPGSLKRSHYLDGDEADDDAKERLRKISSISSISPNMLMNRSFLESVQDVSEPDHTNNEEEDGEDGEDDDTQSDGSIKFQEQFNGASEITFPISNFTNLAAMMAGNNTSFLYDPSNVEVTTDHSPLKSSPEKPLQQKKQQKLKKIARSQATIDLKPLTAEQTEANNNGGSDIINNGETKPQSGEDLIKVRNLEDHPLIDRSLTYDKPIIFGRKRVVKSASTNSLNEDDSNSNSNSNSQGLKITKSGKPKKSHPCPLCGVILQRPEHVKRHMNSHSSEKPFVCEEPDCGVRFNRKDNLRAHIRNIHHMNV